jgi:hypothetical protein
MFVKQDGVDRGRFLNMRTSPRDPNDLFFLVGVIAVLSHLFPVPEARASVRKGATPIVVRVGLLQGRCTGVIAGRALSVAVHQSAWLRRTCTFNISESVGLQPIAGLRVIAFANAPRLHQRRWLLLGSILLV